MIRTLQLTPIKCIGIAVVVAIYSALTPNDAIAQDDAALIAKLARLTKQKGIKDVPLGKACEAFGLRAVASPQGECSGYLAPYDEPDGYVHIVLVFDEPGTDMTRVMIGKDKRGVQQAVLYLVRLDGTLERAAHVSGQETQVWTLLPNANASQRELEEGLKAELVYWRKKQTKLETEPDCEFLRF